MKIVILDLETTGLPPKNASYETDFLQFPHILSMSWKCVKDNRESETFEYLINPEGKYTVPPEATAINGITQEMVDAFDNAHLDTDDPGLLPEAPYHKEHLFALIVEGMLANQLEVDFTYNGAYNNKLGEICPSEPSDNGESKSMFEGKK